MRSLCRATVSGFVALLACASAGFAQHRSAVELGADAGLFHYSVNTEVGNVTVNTTFTQFELPMRSIRAAFPIDETYAIEPAAGWVYTSGNGTSASDFNADLGLIMNLTRDPRAWNWFLRPFLGFQHSSTGSRTLDRATLGAGIGLRVPATDRISMRYEARYRYLAKNEGTSANVVGLLAGISVYTR